MGDPKRNAADDVERPRAQGNDRLQSLLRSVPGVVIGLGLVYIMAAYVIPAVL